MKNSKKSGMVFSWLTQDKETSTTTINLTRHLAKVTLARFALPMRIRQEKRLLLKSSKERKWLNMTMRPKGMKYLFWKLPSTKTLFNWLTFLKIAKTCTSFLNFVMATFSKNLAKNNSSLNRKKFKALHSNSCLDWNTCTDLASSTETWNLKMFLLRWNKVSRSSKSLISDLVNWLKQEQKRVNLAALSDTLLLKFYRNVTIPIKSTFSLWASFFTVCSQEGCHLIRAL